MIAGCIQAQCTPYYKVLLLCKGIGNDNLYTLLEIMNMMQEKKYAQRHTVALIITFQFFMEFFQYYRQWMCTDKIYNVKVTHL